MRSEKKNFFCLAFVLRQYVGAYQLTSYTPSMGVQYLQYKNTVGNRDVPTKIVLYRLVV